MKLKKIIKNSLEKHLSLFGYNVAGGQFDIMITEGGVGIFNGCTGVIGNAEKQYRGLLSDYEEQVGCDGVVYMKRKSWFQEKSNANFRGDALQGCLFIANWMETASAPTMEYSETPCQGAIKSRY